LSDVDSDFSMRADWDVTLPDLDDSRCPLHGFAMIDRIGEPEPFVHNASIEIPRQAAMRPTIRPALTFTRRTELAMH
jgi:hypothetical protein